MTTPDAIMLVAGVVVTGLLFGFGVGMGITAANMLWPRRIATVNISLPSLYGDDA